MEGGSPNYYFQRGGGPIVEGVPIPVFQWKPITFVQRVEQRQGLLVHVDKPELVYFVGIKAQSITWAIIYVPTLSVRTVEALVILCRCAG